MTSTTRPDVDLLDPELYRSNPHDVWTWMRHNEPVFRDEKNGLWGVTRHADVMDVERRSTVFNSGGSYRAVPEPSESNMIAQDDPRHRQQRMLVQGELTRAAVARRGPEIDALVRELVGECLEAGTFDVVPAIAAQVAARLTTGCSGSPRRCGLT